MGSYKINEHHGDSAPKRVKFANFLATPFVGVLFLVSRLTGTEVQIQFGPGGMCEQERLEGAVLLKMAAMMAKFSDDVVECMEDDDDRVGGFMPPNMHAAFMRASFTARKMPPVLRFIKDNGLTLGDGVPEKRYAEYMVDEDSHDTSESQPTGDK